MIILSIVLAFVVLTQLLILQRLQKIERYLLLIRRVRSVHKPENSGEQKPISFKL